MSKVLQAYLRQTKRVPETLAKYKLNYEIDTEYGIIYPAFRGIAKEELLEDFRACFVDLKAFTTTFHKSWETIQNTDQGMLWMQAIMHYITTYGFESLEIDADGYTYIPEEICEVPELRKFKVIGRITNEETHKIIEDILYKGNMGLKEQTVDDLLIMANDSRFEFNVDSIRNKEVKTRIAYEKGLIPSDPDGVIRLLNRLHTGDTMLIQDPQHLFSFAQHAVTKKEYAFIDMILDLRRKECSEIFYRYKGLFLSIRRRGFKRYVNKIARLAKRNWKPELTADFLSTKILNGWEPTIFELSKLSVSDLVKVYNSINYYAVWSENYPDRMVNGYVIRNGKVFIKSKENLVIKGQIEHIKYVCEMLKDEIRNRLDMKTMLIVDEKLDIAFPTSEKSFIGDIPLYTNFVTNNANVVGISWNKNDIDLSAILKDGTKIGWNSYYKSKGHDVMYSGDMTRAICTNPDCKNYKKQNGQSEGICPDCGKPLQAAEALYIGSDEAVLIMSNLFNMDHSELNLFVAEQDNEFKQEEGYTKNTIIDPNQIIYSTKIRQNTRSESLGVFYKEGEKNLLAFANLGIGNSNVSFSSEVMSDAIDVIRIKSMSCLKLRDIYNVFTQLEFDDYLDQIEEDYPDDSESRIEEVMSRVIDIQNLDKSTLVQLAIDGNSLLTND